MEYVFKLVMEVIMVILHLIGVGLSVSGAIMAWDLPMELEYVYRLARSTGMELMEQLIESVCKIVMMVIGLILLPACVTMLKVYALTILLLTQLKSYV